MTYKGIKNRLDLFLLQNPFKRGMKRSGFSNLLIFFFFTFRNIRNIKSFFPVLVGCLRCVISFSALN